MILCHRCQLTLVSQADQLCEQCEENLRQPHEVWHWFYESLEDWKKNINGRNGRVTLPGGVWYPRVIELMEPIDKNLDLVDLAFDHPELLEKVMRRVPYDLYEEYLLGRLHRRGYVRQQEIAPPSDGPYR